MPVRGTDSDAAARIKGDARMAVVLHRALWDRIRAPAEPILLVRGSRRWRVPGGRLAELAASCGSAASGTEPAGRCSRTGSRT